MVRRIEDSRTTPHIPPKFADSTSERILYDIDVVAVWKPEDELGDQEAGSQVKLTNPNDPSYSQIPRRVFKQVTHRLVRSLEKLAISTTVPRALIQSLPKVASERFMQLSPNCQYLAVLSDHKIEIRTSKSGFETNYAIFTSKRDRDTFPKWRRLSWSPDSKILAASRSDGTIEIINENGGLVCVILSSTSINSDIEKDASGSSFFLEPVAFLCFIDPKRGSNNKLSFEGYIYQYELLVVTFDGTLRSYLINTTETADGRETSRHTRSNATYSREGPSDPGYFAFYHKFSFKQRLSTVACGAVIALNELVLCLGGKSSFENEDEATLPSVACWMLLPERPFYRKLELEGSNDDAIDDVSHLSQGTVDYSGFFYRLLNIFSTWRSTNNNFTDDIIHSMVLSPNQQNLLTLDFSGTVKLWDLYLDKGLELNRSWDQSELNYYARGKEFKDLSLEEFIEKVTEIEDGEITGIPGFDYFDNGKVVSIGWWSDNALILGYQYGSMIIACLPEMDNILGESPESFKSCREITSQCNGRFLVIEHEVKSVKARMINDGFVRYSREQEEGDMEDDESEEAESQLSILISALANSLHYVTDTLLWHFENDPSESRGKIVTVSRKTYRLNRISKISPLELLNRKINALDYDDALVIAETYNLDTDVIYQARWQDAEVSEVAIHDYLDKIHDREWVLSACIHTFSNTPDLLRLLLNYGLKGTDILDEVLNSGTSSNKDKIIKLLRERPFEVDSDMENYLSKLQISEKFEKICQYRHYFLKYLDRLRTYEEIVEEKTRHDIENGSMEDFAENDGWVTFVDYTSTFADDYAVFRDLNIAALAMDYATEEFFKGLNILFTRHGPETLPYRFTILEQIPETVNPDEYEPFLPSVTSNNNSELIERLWHEQPWREIDWVDNPILKQRILPDKSQESEVGGIRLKPVEYPAPSALITEWYIDRAHKIDSVSGQVDNALTLVRHGIKKNVMNLETLEENLDMLAKLVYDCYPNLDSVSKNMTLKEFETLTEAEIVQVFLQHTDEKRIVNDVKNFVIPFLKLLPSRRARLNHILKGDETLISESENEALDLLYNYILDVSLSNLELGCVIFEASRPSLNTGERIITSDEDLARIALACLYGNSSIDNWEIMSRIYECLPVFDVEVLDEHRTNFDINLLRSCTPHGLFPLFKSKNEYQLRSIIDSLKLHLNAAKVLARYDNAVPLCWFLQSSDNYTLQKQLCVQLLRKSGGELENDGKSEDEWILLLEEILNLQDNGKGVLSKLSTEEIYKIFISSLLSCGKFNLASKIILPTDQPQPLDMAVAEQLVIDASREFFDNAPSGNMYYGYMKLAYECLQILPISDTIQAEIEFIEATHTLTEQKVYHQPGIPIHPMQIRLAPNKLDLITRLLSTNEDAYYDSKSIMELAKKLGYRNDKVAEVKVMAMLADAALRDSNLSFAYSMCIDIVKIIKSMKNETILNSGKDVAWRICYEVAKQETFQNLEKQMTLMGYALALCPSDQAVDILNVWRKIDNEYRLELVRKASEKSTEKPKSERLKPVVERVESSLLTPLLQGDRIKSVFSRFF